MYDGAPVYSKGKGYVIYRHSMSMGPNNWFISVWYGDVNSIGNSLQYYGSPNNADSMIPPTDGWMVYSYGVRPAPNLRLVTVNNDDSIPNHIMVSACGNVELNGRYQREPEGSGMFREYNHAPVYTKKGEWKGKNVTFAIFREVYSSKPIAWYIGRSNTRCQRISKDERRTLFKCQTTILLPPKKGWIIIGTARGGVNPAPTLSY